MKAICLSVQDVVSAVWDAWGVDTYDGDPGALVRLQPAEVVGLVV